VGGVIEVACMLLVEDSQRVVVVVVVVVVVSIDGPVPQVKCLVVDITALVKWDLTWASTTRMWRAVARARWGR